MGHQPALVIRLEMMLTLISRECCKETNIFCGDCALPGQCVSDLHCWSQAVTSFTPDLFQTSEACQLSSATGSRVQKTKSVTAGSAPIDRSSKAICPRWYQE